MIRHQLLNKAGAVVCLCIIFFISGLSAHAQSLDYQPKILLVTAHPDDDALFSATVFKTTHLLEGTVHLALLTNGEGGYKYSTLGNYIYEKQLDKEEVGREELPKIRKKELKAGGRIVGIDEYFFFDEVDEKYSQDASVPLARWDTNAIHKRMQQIIKKNDYDFIFTMMPSPETHAHHKASAILTLRAVEGLPAAERPLVLATTITRGERDSTVFRELVGYPITRLEPSVEPFTFDRSQKFGHDDRLDYNIIANWVIAEHKSQGTMQLFMGAENAIEQYWYYALNPGNKADKVRAFFKAVHEANVYTDPNDID